MSPSRTIHSMQPLPGQASMLLRALGAQPRLIAHLTVVHDVAYTLTAAMTRTWPDLAFDRQAVLAGAATHDAAKALYPDELTGPGRRHENNGPDLLLAHGLPDHIARFARTHGQWAHERALTLEDLLVALADTVWKGKRNERLEMMLVQQLAPRNHEEPWETFMKLDDILQAVTQDADARLAWCAQHPA